MTADEYNEVAQQFFVCGAICNWDTRSGRGGQFKDTPIVLISRDHNDLRVEFRSAELALQWLRDYWRMPKMR